MFINPYTTAGYRTGIPMKTRTSKKIIMIDKNTRYLGKKNHEKDIRENLLEQQHYKKKIIYKCFY